MPNKVQPKETKCWIHRCNNPAKHDVRWRGIVRRMCDVHEITYGMSAEKLQTYRENDK